MTPRPADPGTQGATGPGPQARSRSGGQPSGRRAAPGAADEDPSARARSIALGQLDLAARTRAQLSRALARRQVSEEVAEAVLDRLEELGLIDDAEFAQGWVEDRRRRHGRSRRALRAELSARGVHGDLIREAVDGISDEDELELARAVVRQRLRGLREVDPVRKARRLVTSLARRGYGSATARQAVREVLAEQGEDLDEDAWAHDVPTEDVPTEDAFGEV